MPASNYENAVREFHTAFGLELDQSKPSMQLLQLRAKLIAEEAHEVQDAFFRYMWCKETGVSCNEAKAHLAKELADLLYVVFGTSEAIDIDISTVYNRVHSSNMSKLGEDGKPIHREDGKAMKGPNYKLPDLSYIKE